MLRWSKKVVCSVMLLGAVYVSAQAQMPVYRCGNTYTNHIPQAKHNGCQPLREANFTVVQSTNQGVLASSPAVAPEIKAQHQSRGSEARAILQAEWAKAREELDALHAQLNDGAVNKTALELRNPQVAQERIEALRSRIARQEADIAGIERELKRYGDN